MVIVVGNGHGDKLCLKIDLVSYPSLSRGVGKYVYFHMRVT